jgi:hypothetical protein
MSPIIKPGAGVLYMKVGTHAQETLDDIIIRKTKEIEQAGVAFWGYGGNTCHPQTMVQPFAKTYEERGGAIYLCMQPMVSKHFAVPVRAEEFSVDGINWEKISPEINVLGSRYALVIRNLHKEAFDLMLSKTKVALGTSMGAVGSKYISGRVDKACLEVTDNGHGNAEDQEAVRHIGLVAEIVKPYAVYVRNIVK